MRTRQKFLLFQALFLIGVALLHAQDSDSIPMTVTYITSRQVYFDAGSEEGVAVGDTVSLFQSGNMNGTVAITAVASRSSVGRILSSQVAIKQGDKGNLPKQGRIPSRENTVPPVVTHDTSSTVPPSPGSSPLQEAENILSGRIGLQFSGEWADDSRLNVAQPAAVADLRILNLGGTGMNLSLYGREYSELTGAYYRYGDSVRSRLDLYQFQLEMDRTGDWYGFSAGRMTSRYVSGLGTFDGGQFFLRQGAFTTGVLVGKGTTGRALGTGENDTRTAVFAGFRSGDQSWRYYEASIAYARQTVHGNLDRSFMYLQGSTALGADVSMFGNAEIDLNTMSNGTRVSSPQLSSAMFYISYFPERWLSASFGYDGTRSIYLFESMKNIPDSLINESIRHGLHGRLTYRPLTNIVLTGMAGYGIRKGDPRNTRTFGGEVRFLDIFGTGIHAGGRFTDITNLYLNGTDIAYELERFFASNVSAILRYDSYSYAVVSNGHTYKTQTFSGNLNWYLTRSWYSSARGEYILDDTMNSLGVFLEVGIRF